MNKYLFMCFLCTLLLFVVSCSNQNKEKQESSITTFFKGNHNLLCLKNYDKTVSENYSSSSGGFILLFGGYTSTSYSKIVTSENVKFWWLNNKKEYMMLEFPINKIRFSIDSEVNIPYCKFRWRDCDLDFDEDDYREYIIYITLVLKQEHLINDGIHLKL